MPFVLDASIAACWAFDDEDHPVAALALERVRTDEARVPSLWWFEVRNTLIVSERRGRLTESDTATFLHGLAVSFDLLSRDEEGNRRRRWLGGSGRRPGRASNNLYFREWKDQFIALQKIFCFALLTNLNVHGTDHTSVVDLEPMQP